MNLKEYIKQYIRELLDEESTSGDAGAYSTPFAFSKNKQKKTAEQWGMKLAPEGIPSDSKIMDYKNLTGQKKKKYKLYKESDYDKASPYTAASKYGAASGYTGVGKDNHPNGYYGEKSTSTDMKESLLMNIIKEELLNEVTYSKFKTEVKFRTKNEQLHKAIREVKRKLNEIDRIVEYTTRMKQELSEGEEGLRYWKGTEKNIAQISETINKLTNKIKNLHQ